MGDGPSLVPVCSALWNVPPKRKSRCWALVPDTQRLSWHSLSIADVTVDGEQVSTLLLLVL